MAGELPQRISGHFSDTTSGSSGRISVRRNLLDG